MCLILDGSDKRNGFWNRQSRGSKAGFLISAALVGWIFIVLVAGGLYPSDNGYNINSTNTNNNPTTSTVSDIPVSNNSSSSESNIQEMTKYDMGYEHGYLDGYNGDSNNDYSGDFGKGYSIGYKNGINDFENGLNPEWQVNEVVYKRWSPSDTAYVDITTGQEVNQ